MKKIINLLVTLFICVILCGCGAKYTVSFSLNGTELPEFTTEVREGSKLKIPEEIIPLISYKITDEKTNKTSYEYYNYTKFTVNEKEVYNIDSYEINEDTKIEINCTEKNYMLTGKNGCILTDSLQYFNSLSKEDYDSHNISELYGRKISWVLDEDLGYYDTSLGVKIRMSDEYIGHYDCKVTYHLGDETFEEVVKYGEKVKGLDIDLDKYIFYGWVGEKDKDCTKLVYDQYLDYYKYSYFFGTPTYLDLDNLDITEDMDLYADVIECSSIAVKRTYNYRLYGAIYTATETYKSTKVELGNYLTFPHGVYLVLNPSGYNLSFAENRITYISDNPDVIDYVDYNGSTEFIAKQLGKANVTVCLGDRTTNIIVEVVPEGSFYAGDNGGAMIPD